MSKAIVSSRIISLAMLVLLSGAARGQTESRLRVPGFVASEDVMVSLGPVFRFLGYTPSWVPATDVVSLGRSSGVIAFTIGQSQAEYRASASSATRTAELPTAPRYAGHMLNGPINSLCALAGMQYTVVQQTPKRVEFAFGQRRLVVELLPEEDKIVVDLARGSVVKLDTVKGEIYLDLFDAQTPVTAGSFLHLTTRGFYDGLTFHRVIDDFMIQGGDPRGDGIGGPGFTIPDEADRGLRHLRGSLSMAKCEPPNTGGSQFFICHLPQPHLDGVHTVFGRCIEGMRQVDRIQSGDAITKATVIWKSDAADEAVSQALSARVPDPEE